MEKSTSKKTPSPTAQPFVPGRHSTHSSSVTSTPSLHPSNSNTAASKPRVNLPASLVPCRYFAAGYCQRGPTCFYKHDLSSVTLPGLEKADKGKKATRETENTDTCAICYEIPATYGLLTNCDHVFCLSCIRAWRSTAAPDAVPDSEGGVLSKTSKTCPLCRVRSKFIIPSSVFPRPVEEPPDEGEKLNPAKDAIIAAYLAKLKTIPCRHFTNSLGPNAPPRPRRDLPDCPFGNDCHYKHTFRGYPYVFSDSELNAQRRRRTHNPRRMGWMERLIFGAAYDPGNDLALPPPWLVPEAEARTLMEIILEGGDPPEWDEFEPEEDEDDEEFYEDDDDDDPFDHDWEQHILDVVEYAVPHSYNSSSRWVQSPGAGDESDVFPF
ncbi:hypothetical protein L873DRAFT_1825910 [Choiromyces venosus 120613-1]|uniref:Uncharacterized protein n=1 Tax=Choiromyces venosus 120613-1 TaxID=1336337 RepID=A0A3N4K0E0_9PEZI|nr:hypothetical protein L873DRAFT_1825910 [Choiromyces venosus 120613-1]